MENFSVTFLIFSVTFLYDLWYTNPCALKTRIEYQMEEISKYEQKENEDIVLNLIRVIEVQIVNLFLDLEIEKAIRDGL